MARYSKEERRIKAIAYYSSDDGWSQVMWNSARQRAKRAGLEFGITREDILACIPKDRRCPLLRMDLKIGSGRMTDGSGTVDRVLNSVGYIPSNIWVISNKANRMKSSGTPAELMKIARGVERRQRGIR